MRQVVLDVWASMRSFVFTSSSHTGTRRSLTVVVVSQYSVVVVSQYSLYFFWRLAAGSAELFSGALAALAAATVTLAALSFLVTNQV